MLPLTNSPAAGGSDRAPASNEAPGSVLVARVGDRRLALPAAAVERILRMAEVTPLPGAPPGVAGVLNVQGSVLPVVDPRPRLATAGAPAQPDQHLVLVASVGGRYLLWVDGAERLEPVEPGSLIAVDAAASEAGATWVARLGADLVPVFAAEALAPRGLGQATEPVS
jgi:purine-binding chemotaxis protein CheW